MKLKNNIVIFFTTLFIVITILILNFYTFYLKKFELKTNDYMLIAGVAILIPYILATINSILKGNIDMSIKSAYKISISIIIFLAILQFALVLGMFSEFSSLANILSVLEIAGFAIFTYLLYYLIQNFAVKHKIIFQVVFLTILITSGVLTAFLSI